MNTISNGAQLKELAGKCGTNEKELSQISVSMNKEFNNLTQEIYAQVEIVDESILVILILFNQLKIMILLCLINIYFLENY